MNAADFENRLKQDLNNLKAKSLLRELTTTQGLIDFASNDYLSLNRSGFLNKLLLSEIERYKSNAVGSTGSRLISGHSDTFEEAEQVFADYTGSESALLFTSGYSANTGVISALVNPVDEAFCDRLCHASIMDGVRLSRAKKTYFQHNDLNDLETKLKKSKSKTKWIFIETLYSMDGDSPDIEALYSLAESYGALVYADEAHAAGIAGAEGRGLTYSIDRQQKPVTVFPLGKAFGLAGCMVCGTGSLKSWLINKARSFVFSTAQPPLLAGMIRSVTEFMLTDDANAARKNLESLVSQALKECSEKKLRVAGTRRDPASPIIPVLIGDADAALRTSGHLKDQGFDIRAIRPPTVPDGTSRLRLNLHANDSLDNLKTAIAEIARSLQAD